MGGGKTGGRVRSNSQVTLAVLVLLRIFHGRLEALDGSEAPA